MQFQTVVSIKSSVNNYQVIVIFAPMIAYLKGNFNSKTPSSVIVDVNGVGYDVTSASTPILKFNLLKVACSLLIY